MKIKLFLLITFWLNIYVIGQIFTSEEPQRIQKSLEKDSPRDIRKFLEMKNPKEAAILLKDHLNKNGIDLNFREKKSERSKVERIDDLEIRTFNGTNFTPVQGIEESLQNKINMNTLNKNTQENLLVDKENILVVQFWVSLSYDDLIKFLDFGVRFLESLGNNSYIINCPKNILNKFVKEKNIRWVGEYSNSYKYDLNNYSSNNSVSFVYVLGPNDEQYKLDLINYGIQINNYDKTNNFYEVLLDQSQYADVCNQFWWIKGIIVAPIEENLSMTDVTVNYEPNDSRELILAYSTPFSGNGVTVGVRDDGIYSDHPQLRDIFNINSELNNNFFHGTHVTGIIAGRQTNILGNWGNSFIKGVSDGVFVLFRSKYLSLEFYSNDFNSFIENNAQISNHSYGFVNYLSGDFLLNYNSYTEDFDGYTDDNDLLIVVSAGNNFNPYTITNPSTAKNVITVGALNYVTIGFNTIGINSFSSSKGPTQDDKRLKPDVVAPGGGDYGVYTEYDYGVVSTSSQPWDMNPSTFSGSINNEFEPPEWESNDYYLRSSGTSMAAPHVTGILAKMKEWDNTASSELLKANLINTTIPLKGNSDDALGGYANNEYGYGMVNGFLITDNISGETQRLLYAQSWLTEDDDPLYQDFNINVPIGTKKLAVTLAYNDLKGETSDNVALKDNLDLILISPTGETYYAFQHLAENVLTESPLEKMVIENPQEFGNWTVRVQFKNGPGFGDPNIYAAQRFAVVAHAILKTPEIQISIPETTINALQGSTIELTPTITNIGGYIAAGVTIIAKDETNSFGETNISRYLTNLIGQNSAATPTVMLTAPTIPGLYDIILEADGINKEFNSPQTITIHINVTQPTISVTTPVTGAQWTPNTNEFIYWNSENVTGDVNIKFSMDGGITFPMSLISNTPNDGEEQIIVPSLSSALCRIKVESATNPDIFGLNPGNFTISSTSQQNTLSAGTVSPTSGSTTDNFNFSVIYKSSSNTPSTNVQLHIINQFTETMTANGSNWLDGVQFTKTLSNFSVGTYEYYFSASVNGEQLRYPDEGNLQFSVTQHVAGWDLGVDIDGTYLQPSAIGPGTAITVNCDIQNFSNTGNIYINVPLSVELRSPSGQLLDQNSTTIPSLASGVGQIYPLNLLCPGDAVIGNYSIIITIFPIIDSNPINNSLTLNFYIGPDIGTELYETPQSEEFVYIDDQFNVCPSNVFILAGVSGGTTPNASIQSPSGNTDKIYKEHLKVYTNYNAAIAAKNIGSNNATLRVLCAINNGGPIFANKEIVGYPGQNIYFDVEAPPSKNFSTNDGDFADIYLTGSSDNQIRDWFDFSSNYNDDKNVKIHFNIPSDVSIGTYVFYQPTSYKNSSDLDHFTKVQIKIVAQPPTLTSLSSYNFSADDEITIIGTAFSSTGTVKFNDLSTTSYISWSPTQIKVKVPVGVQAGNVFVVNSNGTSNGISYTVKSSTGEPNLISPIPDQSIYQNSTKLIANLNNVFSEPNNQSLTFTVTSSNPEITYDQNLLATGELHLIASASASGTSTIEVTATDPDNKFAADQFIVTILSNQQSYITLTSPNGGEEWTIGSVKPITWLSNGTSGNVKIEISLDNENSWSDLFANTIDDSNEPWLINTTTSELVKLRISDANGNPVDVSDNVFKIINDPNIYLSAKIFLQGNYSSGTMSTSLNTADQIPHSQPFRNAPWSYNGSESVTSIPNTNIVDWILVELRSGTEANTVVAKRAGFLRNDGKIVDLDGFSKLSFSNLNSTSYYVAIYHRNHLPIMSSEPVQLGGSSEILETFDNAVGNFFPDPPVEFENFYRSGESAYMNLTNTLESIDGNGSTQVDYKAEVLFYSDVNGWVVRTTYPVPNNGEGLPYLDLSEGSYLSLWCKILNPAFISNNGQLFFEFKLAEFNEENQRDLFVHKTSFNLLDNSGAWSNVLMPLIQTENDFDGFAIQFADGDGILQLKNIKGFEIIVTYFPEGEWTEIPYANGSFLIDKFELIK
ncbi:MAG: S8 family serine peptidase [Melioribacteraceae bacterium]